MRVDWSQRAVSDLSALHDYIASDSPVYAERFIARLIQAAEPLADFQELGRTPPKNQSELSFENCSSAAIESSTAPMPSRILIVAVIHGSRDGGSRLWKQE